MAKSIGEVKVRVETGMPEMKAGAILVVEHTDFVELLLSVGRLIQIDEDGQVVFREGTDPAAAPAAPAVPVTTTTPQEPTKP